VSAKVAELGIARRNAKTFPRKRAIAPTEDEIPLPYPSSASVFQTFPRKNAHVSRADEKSGVKT
jgi:hypothetical protein